MNKLLPLARWLSSILLHSSLFFLIASIVFSFVVSNKQVLKDSLSTSGIYSSFVDNVIDTNTNHSNQTLSSLPIGDANVRTIIKSSFSPQFLQAQTNGVIDNTYSWLQGDTVALNFAFDISSAKQTMNESLANYAAVRVASLPQCDSLPSEVNVFTIDCHPAAMTSEFVREQTLSDLNQAEFLKNSVLTKDNLPKTNDGKTIDQKYSFIPQIYQFMQNGLLISAVLFLLSTVLFIMLRKPYQKGLRAYGRDILSNSIMLIILTIIFGFILPRYTHSFGLASSDLSSTFTKVSDAYIGKIDILVLNVAIQMAAVGLGLLLILRINAKTSIYSGIAKKSGVSSSLGRPQPGIKRSERPPIQTSEDRQKPRSRKATARTKKYSKIKM